MKKVQFEICWHNPIVANSISEALEQIQAYIPALEKLRLWEKEGKVKAECGCDSPSFQIIEVLDKSIQPELKKMGLLSCSAVKEDEDFEK